MGKYFTVEECCVSASHPKLVEVPEEGSSIYKNIQYMIERLDIIREKWGGPIIVTSGYRNNLLNQAVGGSKTSAHRTGLAVDIHPKNGNIMELAEVIANSGLEYDQLILERITVKNYEIKNCDWIHLGFSRVNPRKQILAFNGKQYLPVKLNNVCVFKI